jgi:hypothetical protein
LVDCVLVGILIYCIVVVNLVANLLFLFLRLDDDLGHRILEQPSWEAGGR